MTELYPQPTYAETFKIFSLVPYGISLWHFSDSIVLSKLEYDFLSYCVKNGRLVGMIICRGLASAKIPLGSVGTLRFRNIGKEYEDENKIIKQKHTE